MWTMRKRTKQHANILSQLDVGRIRFNAGFNPTGIRPWDTDTVVNCSPIITEYIRQETEDVDRKFHPRKKAPEDDGGPFKTKILKIRCGTSPFVAHTGPYALGPNWYQKEVQCATTLRGATVDNIVAGNSTTLLNMWNSFTYPGTALTSYGTRAFTRLDPTRDVAPDVLQFLVELKREGIPSIPGKIYSKLKRLKSSGSEYLNGVFGWKPLLSDIRDMLVLYKELDEKLSQLRRDNNHKVRRSGTITFSDNTSASSPFSWASSQPLGTSTGLGGSDEVAGMTQGLVTRTRSRIWFAGRGSYILPIELLPNPMHGKVDEYLSLLQASVSPSTVYDLIPWTWLIDWFANLGELVEATFGHGVGTYTADYCYLMRKTEVTETYSTFQELRGAYSVPTSIHPSGYLKPAQSRQNFITVEKVTKERIAATPFGFGLTTGSLSGNQYAILTALGLSRQNFS